MSGLERRREDKVARWWFGGTAAACGVCFTHPLDLLKVHLQTQHGREKYTLMMAAKDVVTKQGFSLLPFFLNVKAIFNNIRGVCIVEWFIRISFKTDDVFAGAFWNLRNRQTDVSSGNVLRAGFYCSDCGGGGWLYWYTVRFGQCTDAK